MNNRISTIVALCTLSLATGCSKNNDRTPPVSQYNAIPLDCQIVSDMTLKDHNPNGIDYIVSCYAEVSGAHLTIEPGVTIQFKEDASLQVNDDASIAVNGTAAKPVTMSGSKTGACWWGLLVKSDDAKNIINHLTISNTGYGEFFHDVFAGFIFDARMAIGIEGSASITNTTVDDCAGVGIVYGSGARITGFSNNVIKNCASYPLMVSSSMLTSTLDLTSSVYSGNSENYIALYSRTSNNVVDEEVVFKEISIPYLSFNSMEFHKNIRMDAGVQLHMEEERFLSCTGENVTWTINGTAAKPVVIKGKMNGAGYWSGLLLGGKSKGTFNYLDVSGGGHDYTGINVPFKANINVGDTYAASLTVNSCTSSGNAHNCDIGVHDRGALLINNSPAIPNICQE